MFRAVCVCETWGDCTTASKAGQNDDALAVRIGEIAECVDVLEFGVLGEIGDEDSCWSVCMKSVCNQLIQYPYGFGTICT